VLLPGGQDLFDRRVGSHILYVGTRAWDADASAQLEAAVRAATPSKQTPVLITNTPCSGLPSEASALRAAAERRVVRFNEFVAAFVDAHEPEVRLGDLDGLLCRAGEPIAAPAGQPWFDSKQALTTDGAQSLWRWITREVGA
jgi:hypothetical protein